MHYSMKRVGLALLAAACFAGCGQKGPLYLPGDPSEIRSTVPRQQPVEQTEPAEDDEDGVPRTYHQ